MKIVQTCQLGAADSNAAWHCTGGWISPEYHWMSWTLSCFQLRQFYGKVELYADEQAIQLLIDELKLPYTKVHLIDKSVQFDKQAWALAKVNTYKKQSEPFLHVDGDVFIWRKLNEDLMKSSLIAQNLERNFKFYPDSLKQYRKRFDYIPSVFQDELSVENSCNAGIIGGSNIEFFQEYTNEAIKFVNLNRSHVEDIDSTLFCMTFEQLLFYKLSEKLKINISYLLEEFTDSGYSNIGNLTDVPFWKTYAHPMGSFKSNSVAYTVSDLICRIFAS